MGEKRATMRAKNAQCRCTATVWGLKQMVPSKNIFFVISQRKKRAWAKRAKTRAQNAQGRCIAATWGVKSGPPASKSAHGQTRAKTRAQGAQAPEIIAKNHMIIWIISAAFLGPVELDLEPLETPLKFEVGLNQHQKSVRNYYKKLSILWIISGAFLGPV